MQFTLQRLPRRMMEDPGEDGLYIMYILASKQTLFALRLL